MTSSFKSESVEKVLTYGSRTHLNIIPQFTNFTIYIFMLNIWKCFLQK